MVQLKQSGNNQSPIWNNTATWHPDPHWNPVRSLDEIATSAIWVLGNGLGDGGRGQPISKDLGSERLSLSFIKKKTDILIHTVRSYMFIRLPSDFAGLRALASSGCRLKILSNTGGFFKGCGRLCTRNIFRTLQTHFSRVLRKQRYDAVKIFCEGFVFVCPTREFLSCLKCSSWCESQHGIGFLRNDDQSFFQNHRGDFIQKARRYDLVNFNMFNDRYFPLFSY